MSLKDSTRPVGRIAKLKYHSYRTHRREERKKILIQQSVKQMELKLEQQKFRRMVREILTGSARNSTKKWWNNVVRESSDIKRSLLVRKLFGRVRHSDVGRVSTPLLKTFRSLETDILDVVMKGKAKYLKACRGAKNLGLSLGCTFVPGHRKIYQQSPFQRDNQALVKELKSVANFVFEEAFGSEDWYVKLRRLVHDAVFAIHGQEGLDCLFGNLPITCVWLSLVPQANIAHVDVNAGPASFVMTTTNCIGGELIISSPVDGTIRQIMLKPGHILGGSWALFKHWNMQVSKEASGSTTDSMNQRHSWIFYLNRNILNIGDWQIVNK